MFSFFVKFNYFVPVFILFIYFLLLTLTRIIHNPCSSMGNGYGVGLTSVRQQNSPRNRQTTLCRPKILQTTNEVAKIREAFNLLLLD